MVVLAAWRLNIEHIKSLHISLLLLTTGMIGTFVALDLFLFYVFWEITLIPMYFIIGVWGGPRRIYASVKFFLFTMAGSVLMLVAVLYLAWFHHQQTGIWSYNYLDLWTTAPLLPVSGGLLAPGLLVFAAFAVAFAVKVPIFPFHTWLPDAHVEAPTAGSVILAGVLLKMGGYGFIRFNRALLPDAWDLFTPLHRGAGGDRHHLRRPGRHGAARRQEARRLLFGQPHGLRHARARGRHPGVDPGRDPADGRTTVSRPAASSWSSGCSTSAATRG